MDNPNHVNNTTATEPRKRLNPLVATAAGAVIVASLAATAAITGVLPKAGGSPSASTPPAAIDTTAPASGAANAPATLQAQQAAPATQSTAARGSRTGRAVRCPAAPPQYTQQPAPQPQAAVCHTCGTVVARSPKRAPKGTAPGSAPWAARSRAAWPAIRSKSTCAAKPPITCACACRAVRNAASPYRNPPPFGQGERVHIERGTLAAG
ncbi:MAG: hypothetical protein GAK41_01416 [Burkholderia gladioli]|nr:MAG: hypothetical protein GAK41_01416 [Burkholderia gladioli]